MTPTQTQVPEGKRALRYQLFDLLRDYRTCDVLQGISDALDRHIYLQPEVRREVLSEIVAKLEPAVYAAELMTFNVEGEPDRY